MREQIAVVKELAPLASAELDALIRLVEDRRFNDEATADAVEALRELHWELGDLLRMADAGAVTREAVAALEAGRRRLLSLLSGGAKVAVVAPALTLGVVHLLSWVTGVGVDSTMVTGVFGSLLGADALRAHGRSTGL